MRIFPNVKVKLYHYLQLVKQNVNNPKLGKKS